MKKKLLIVLCCVLALGLFTGCAAKENGQSDGTNSSSTATESTPETDESGSGSESGSSFQPITDGGNFDVGEDYQ